MKGIKIGSKQSKILKKVRSLPVIMDLVMTKTTNNFLVNVNQKTVVDIL